MKDMTTMSLPCLASGFLMSLVAILFVISALGLIFIILLQKGRGGGLSAALGGGMASGILGAKTGDVLTWVTISLVGVFLFLAVLMTKYWRPTTQQFGVTQNAPTRQSQPAVPSQPVPSQPARSSAPAPVTPAGPNK
jgi:preprotein translocase subunit SecG